MKLLSEKQISTSALTSVNQQLLLILLLLALVMMGCSGCGGMKSASMEKEAVTTENIKPIPPYKDTDRVPHSDSLKKWSAQHQKDLAQFVLNPDSNTISFTIDPKTGIVNGCPLIEFKGIYDWKEDSLLWVREQVKFDNIKSRLEKAWMGTKEIVVSDEFPEGEDRYPSKGFFSKNDEFVIVPDGHAHGGTIDRVYFFDKNGNLLKLFKLGYNLEVPNFEMNAEKTFFVLSSSVSPKFYIFYPDGRIFIQGDYHKITKDHGTSYGAPIVSESGNYLVLRNNLSWLFDKNLNLLTKLKMGGNGTFNSNLNAFLFTYGTEVSILSLKSMKISYKSKSWNNGEIGLFQNSKLYLDYNKARYEYEIIDD